MSDGRLKVTFEAGGLMEMGWHLLMWGDHVEVKKPKDFWKKFEAGKKIPVLP